MTANSTSPTSFWKTWIWPIEPHENKKVLLLALLGLILAIDYNILRVLKDTLIATDPQLGPKTIPFLKIWALLPATLAMAWFYTFLSKRFSQEKVFYILMSLFLGYFTLFLCFFYPYREILTLKSFGLLLRNHLPSGFEPCITILEQWPLCVFYILSELWASTVLLILFWGFSNRISTAQDAKRYYAPLIFFQNLSGVIAGQLALFLSGPSLFFFTRTPISIWEESLKIKIGFVVITGAIAIGLYRWMHLSVIKDIGSQPIPAKQKEKMGLLNSLRHLFSSAQLWPLACMVWCYFFSLGIMEILWQQQLRQLYPQPLEFSNFLNQMNSLIGIASTLIALFVTGNVLRRFHWVVSALLTPTLLIVSLIGFAYVFGNSSNNYQQQDPQQLERIVLFGAAYLCLGRICKFTFFDTSKELAFVDLPLDSQIKGKTIIDGLIPKFGKTSESVYLQGMLVLFQGLEQIIPLAMGTLFGANLLWIYAAGYLGLNKSKVHCIK